MASYLPPLEIVSGFNSALYVNPSGSLTVAEANLLYLEYPQAQGSENLQIVTASGLLTLNGGLSAISNQSINYGINTIQTGNLVASNTITTTDIQINGNLNIQGQSNVYGNIEFEGNVTFDNLVQGTITKSNTVQSIGTVTNGTYYIPFISNDSVAPTYNTLSTNSLGQFNYNPSNNTLNIGDTVNGNINVLGSASGVLVNGTGTALNVPNGSINVGGLATVNTLSAVAGANFLTDVTVNNITIGKGIGYQSTIVGTSSMPNAITGAGNNTAIGYSALGSLTSGTSNTAVGVSSLFSLSANGANTAIGLGSLYQCTGINNTAVGYASGNSGTFSTGAANVTNCTFLGIGAGTANTTATYTHSTAIGANAVLPSGSTNQIVLGSTADTVVVPANITIAGTTLQTGAVTFSSAVNLYPKFNNVNYSKAGAATLTVSTSLLFSLSFGGTWIQNTEFIAFRVSATQNWLNSGVPTVNSIAGILYVFPYSIVNSLVNSSTSIANTLNWSTNQYQLNPTAVPVSYSWSSTTKSTMFVIDGTLGALSGTLALQQTLGAIFSATVTTNQLQFITYIVPTAFSPTTIGGMSIEYLYSYTAAGTHTIANGSTGSYNTLIG